MNEIKEQKSEMVEISPLIKRGWLRTLLFVIAFAIISGIFVGIGGVIIGFMATSADINISMEILSDPAAIIENLGIFPLIIMNLVSIAGLMLTVWLFRKYVDKKSVISLGFSPKNKDMFRGMIWGAGLITIGFLILYSIRAITITKINFNFLSLSMYFIFFVIIALQEEIMFRGYILSNLSESMNKYVALAVSSVFFAIIHLPNGNMSILAVTNLFLAGILLGIYYTHKKNLWFPIGMHITWNFFQGPIFGFEVSGIKTEAVIIQQISGNQLLTGGKFGFEGSVIATLIMIISIIIIHFKFREKRKLSDTIIIGKKYAKPTLST